MKYPIRTSYPCPTIQEMPPVTATALKNQTADVLDQILKQGPVAITRHNKTRAVLIPIEQYLQMIEGDAPRLADLRREYQGMLEEMQKPEQKEGAEQAFNASPEELSRAAVEAAARERAQ